MRIAFFGSSLVSAYWNGACTYYRGLIRALAERGHSVTFYEPDALGRQQHRDIEDPPWAQVVVYEPEVPSAVEMVRRAFDSDLLVKASGVGVLDDVLEAAVAGCEQAVTIFWDVDAPATLGRIEANPDDHMRALIPAFDFVLTYGGGDPVVQRYRALGARRCVPIYNALDPATHHPAPPRPEWEADLSFLGNRLPDREERVDAFFFDAASRLRDHSFLLGGAGWEDRRLRGNVRYVGHVAPGAHNSFNRSALTVLNVSRESMATNGFSPPTRIFEAAGAGACLITDHWEGIELFLRPQTEVLVARDGAEVAEVLASLDPATASELGSRARERVLHEHTYAERARQVEGVLESCGSGVP